MKILEKIWPKKAITKPTTKEEPTKGDQIIEKKEIEGTPFTAIKHEGKWFITLGQYRLANDIKTFAECTEICEKAPWSFQLSVIQAMIEGNNKVREYLNITPNKN